MLADSDVSITKVTSSNRRVPSPPQGGEGPGGETQFRYQEVTVAPRAGKLILFPPFWTHEHRGVTLQRGVKYLATTWVVFA